MHNNCTANFQIQNKVHGSYVELGGKIVIMNLNNANWGLIISLSAMLIVIVPVWKDIYVNNRSTKFINKFTTIGKVLIFTCLAFILINYIKDCQAVNSVEIGEKA